MDSRTHPNNDQILWEHFYEVAIGERDPHIRLQRIAEANKAILDRAKQLEDSGGSDAECHALEDAAEFLKDLKMTSVGDGIGKQSEAGDVEPL